MGRDAAKEVMEGVAVEGVVTERVVVKVVVVWHPQSGTCRVIQ